MHNCDILISADVIITQNAGRDILTQSALAIKDGKISALGECAALTELYQPGRTLKLGKALLMPGLINAHTHMPMTMMRGKADDLPLMDWLNRHIFPMERALNAHILQVGTDLACAEMLRTGTTAFCDMYLSESNIYKATNKNGLKALVGEAIFSFPSLGYKNPADALKVARAQANELSGNPRIRYSIAPHSVYTTTPELLVSCAELALELELPLQIHLAESAGESSACVKLHGCRPVELVRRAGLLGPNTTIAHGVDLTEEEIKLLAQTETVVAHNPRSNMKLASGTANLSTMIEKGVLLGLGTDGAASNNSLNMFAEMSACALLHKLSTLDPTALPAQRVLDMATLGGAKALHWPELGTLSVGSPADLTALDLTSPNLCPLYSPLSHLCYAATGHEVMLTMIDGHILYENGKFNSIDYPALLQEVDAVSAFMQKQK
ncbi:MAG: amidohydrolase [Deltaproteobacteria bacterium]|nr:amidohydrolase [Deltaproteobacteria bacterium]